MGSSHYKDDDCVWVIIYIYLAPRWDRLIIKMMTVRVIIYIYLAPRWDRLIIKMMTVGDYLHLLGAKMGSSHYKDDDYVRVIIYIYLAPRWDRLIIKMMTVLG